MPGSPPSSHGAPDVVQELRRQRWISLVAIAIAGGSFIVALIALFNS